MTLRFIALASLLTACTGVDPVDPDDTDVTDTDIADTEVADTEVTASGDFTLTSTSFADGDALPDDLKCERDGGDGLSPPLAWSGLPADTASIALVMEHWPSEDANPPPNAYWLLWDVPADTTSLSRGNTESVGHEGSDKDGVGTGYTPPCSPGGDVTHDYTIRLYALSEAAGLTDGDDLLVDWTALTTALESITLETAELTFVN